MTASRKVRRMIGNESVRYNAAVQTEKETAA
jgi:hypothetical protein